MQYKIIKLPPEDENRKYKKYNSGLMVYAFKGKKIKRKESYYKYLESKKWKRKSNYLIKKYNFCFICGSKKILQCHHKHYKNLFKEKNRDLAVLCKCCHNHYHNLYKYATFKNFKEFTKNYKII